MSDDTVANQFPFSIKAQATADGFRVTAHVYGDNLDQVITDCANATQRALNELEFRELVIAANQRKTAVEKVPISPPFRDIAVIHAEAEAKRKKK